MNLAHPQNLAIPLPLTDIADICRRLGVSELAIFGSSLRDDFRPDSDIDFLVRFINNDSGAWMSKFMDLEQALATLLNRKVDLVSWRAVEQSTNPYRREHILRTARLIYAQG